MRLTSCPSGVYDYDGFIVTIMPYFVYEVTLGKYWKNGYCYLGSKYYKSNKPLKSKVISKRYKDYTIRKELILIGIPKEYATVEHVPYKKKTNGTRRSNKGSIH